MLENYTESDSRIKSDTNHYSTISNPTPALLALVQNPTALPSLQGFVVSVFGLSLSAVGFCIIVLYLFTYLEHALVEVLLLLLVVAKPF